MLIHLHNRAIVRHWSEELPVVVPLVRTPLATARATTTPKVRAAIQASDAPASVLAERFGTTEQTVYKWRHRDSIHDRSPTPHRLQTTLNPAQEVVAVALHKTLLVSLDDRLAVVGEFLNPAASRSGLDPCVGKTIPRIVF